MSDQLKASLVRFGKALLAAGMAGAAGAVLLAIQNPNATAQFIAASAASGFIAAVLLAAEKFLNWQDTQTKEAPVIASLDPGDPGLPPD